MRRLTLFFALAGTAFSLAAAEVAAPAAPAVPEAPKAPEAQVRKDAPAKKVTANRRRQQFGKRDGQRGMQFGNRRQMMMRNRRQMMMRGNNNCCCCCCCKRGNGEAGFQRPVRRDGKMDFRRGNFRRGDMKNFGPNRNRRFKKNVPQTIPAKNVKSEVPAPAAPAVPAVPAVPAAPAVPAVESK